MNGFPYDVELDDGQRQVEEFWQSEEDERRRERLQDRVDRYVAAMLGSGQCCGFTPKQLVDDAMVFIKAVDRGIDDA